MPGDRARARDLGVVPGALPARQHDAITDVAGILVGHTTLIQGTDIRTGVTAVVPEYLTRPGPRELPAGLFAGNGYGKITGVTQVAELGTIETPIVLTSTIATFRALSSDVVSVTCTEGSPDSATVVFSLIRFHRACEHAVARPCAIWGCAGPNRYASAQ